MDVREEIIVSCPFSLLLFFFFLFFTSYKQASRTGRTSYSRLTSQILPRRVGFRSVSLSVSGLAAKSFLSPSTSLRLLSMYTDTTSTSPTTVGNCVFRCTPGRTMQLTPSYVMMPYDLVLLFLNNGSLYSRYICHRENHRECIFLVL